MLCGSALLANHLVNLVKWKKIFLAKLRVAHGCKEAEPLQQGCGNPLFSLTLRKVLEGLLGKGSNNQNGNLGWFLP